VDIWLHQSVNRTMNSMGISDVTKRILLCARRESIFLKPLYPVECMDILYCVGKLLLCIRCLLEQLCEVPCFLLGNSLSTLGKCKIL